MRILFVDDETSILEGIENRLRKYRKRWDMSFSTGGAEALNLMHDQPFDAIVSDMRMPKMDGAELLTKVREQYDGTLRLILTGQTAKEQLLRSLSVAHRILNKPCDAILLEEAIADAQALQGLIANTDVRNSVDKIASLPTLPKLHNQLTNAIESGESELKDISRIIKQDPVIASRILQLVNSTYLGLAREISSITEAVSYLGLDCVRGLVLNLELFCAFEKARLSPSFSLRHFYESSILSSRIAKLLFGNEVKSDLIFTGSLLHSLGQLVLAYSLPTEYEEVLSEYKKSDMQLLELEYGTLGYTHADVTAYLLSLWNLPFQLIETTGSYYKPSDTTASNMRETGFVHISTVLAAQILGDERACKFDMAFLENQNLVSQLPEWKAAAEDLVHAAKC